jgi:hypothetical protein
MLPPPWEYPGYEECPNLCYSGQELVGVLNPTLATCHVCEGLGAVKTIQVAVTGTTTPEPGPQPGDE